MTWLERGFIVKARKLMFCIGAIVTAQGITTSCKSTNSHGSVLSYGGSTLPAAGYAGSQQGPTGYAGSQQGPTGYEGSQQGSTGYGGSQQGPTGYGGSQQGPTGYGGSQQGPTGYTGSQQSGFSNTGVEEWAYQCLGNASQGYAWTYVEKIYSGNIPAGSLICKGWSDLSSTCSNVVDPNGVTVPCDAAHLKKMSYTW